MLIIRLSLYGEEENELLTIRETEISGQFQKQYAYILDKVKSETAILSTLKCFSYAANTTLQFILIYVCTGPGGSPLMDYFLQKTYLHIHLHLPRIEVRWSCYVGHFPQKASLT